MGDSITAGQYVDAQYRWTNLLSDQLFREYWETEVILHFVCRGISGETTRQGLERFPMDVQAAVPDVLTLQFGLNDCNCWVTDRGNAARVGRCLPGQLGGNDPPCQGFWCS